MIHMFAANVHYKECQIQLTTGQVCCQTVKDYSVFYQTCLVPTYVRQETENRGYLDILPFLKYAWHGSLFASPARETFGNWNPEVFLQCDMVLLLDSRDCETYSILRIGYCVSGIKVHEDNRLVSLDSLLSEALPRKNEGGLLAQPRILSYWSIHHVLRKKVPVTSLL